MGIKHLEGLKFLSLESVDEITGQYQYFLSATFPNVKIISGFSLMNYFSVLFNGTRKGV